jgi:branched-chain amino acid transport system ATP-binding protein
METFMSTVVLRTEDLSKSFGELVVTRHVNFEILTGERHAVIGPNGAGKTSLINQIGGQLTPSSGKIFVNGRNVVGMRPDERCHLGVARTFQRNCLFLNLTAAENVRLAIQARIGTFNPFRSITGSGAHQTETEAALHIVRLLPVAKREVRLLSYGERRQLEIAVALAGNPSVLLLDEPTSGMSPAETGRMIDLIRELPTELGIMLVEHDMKVVFSLAHKITVLHYGAALAVGTPEEISANSQVREVYLGKRRIQDGDLVA